MATAKQLPSGTWRVQVYAGKDAAGNRQYKSFTAATQRKAELAALEWQERYREITEDSSSMTVEEAVAAYIELKSNVLSPTTIRGYDTISRAHFESINNIKLNKLTQNRVQQLVNEKSATLAPKTVKNIYTFISALMRQYRPDTPMGRVKLPQKKKPNNRALSQSEIATLLTSIVGDRIEVPILLAVWLGMRRSEVAALRWNDVDFEHKTITVDEALIPDKNNKYVFKPPKTTDSERTLSLPDYILQKIRELPRGDDDTERIFSAILPNSITMHFARVAKSAGLENVTFHDLRRSMATIGVSLNIADKLIMARGGWNNPATMKQIYQVVLSDDMNTVDALFNDYFEKILPSDTTQNATR